MTTAETNNGSITGKEEASCSSKFFDESTLEFGLTSGDLWSRPGFLVRRLHQIHCALFFEECKEGGITPVQFAILSVLAREPWLDQTTVGYEVGLDRTTAADVIKRLEEKGLLNRRVNPLDRRSRQAAVTRKAQNIMAGLIENVARSQRRLLQPLSSEDQKVFMSLVIKLIESNNQYGRTTLSAF
ncbi:MAG: MarR family transcriptional regulator [Burkholderiaceae bacterium]|nr:MAG: MarR family transcriptional regulator [Burkholderiaceae bacterium]